MTLTSSNQSRWNGRLRLSRRALVAAAGAGGTWSRATAQTPEPEGSPVASPAGFDDARRWRGRSIRVGAWGGEVQAGLSQAVFAPFATATGCEVLETVTHYRRLAPGAGTAPAYADVLIVDPIWAATALAEGLIEPIPADAIERSSIGSLPATDGSVPAYAYAMVSAFRRDAVTRQNEPAGWAAWWDVERYQARRALPRQALGCFEFALLADGVPADQLYPLDGARAIASLARISDHIGDRWWDDGRQPVTWLSRNQTDFAAAWHYRVVAGQRDGRAVAFVWQQGLLVADYWVVPRGARNQDVALDLIRYATTPEVQAALARAIPLGPVAPRAFDALTAAEARTLPTAPDTVGQLVLLDAPWWAQHRTEENDRFDEWLAGIETDE